MLEPMPRFPAPDWLAPVLIVASALAMIVVTVQMILLAITSRTRTAHVSGRRRFSITVLCVLLAYWSSVVAFGAFQPWMLIPIASCILLLVVEVRATRKGVEPHADTR